MVRKHQNPDRPPQTNPSKSMPPLYKPTPLRASPFVRPHSPASQASLRQTTPSSSPIKSPPTARHGGSPVPPAHGFSTPRGRVTVEDVPESVASSSPPPPVHTFPLRTTPRPMPTPPAPAPAATGSVAHGNALSKLLPSQVRTMREAFQILDRDSDGMVNREDVVDMLNQLGTWNTYIHAWIRTVHDVEHLC